MTSAMVIDQDGEVIAPRRRERNAGRILEVLPPTAGAKVAALERMSAQQQIEHVNGLLNNSRSGLLAAIEAQSIPGIVEHKAKSLAIQMISKQLKLSRAVQDDAVVLVRMSERAIAVAIRYGQSIGTVETKSDALARGAQAREIKAGRRSFSPGEKDRKIAVATLLTPTEQSGGKSREFSVFNLSDGVTDEQFEEALAQARGEGNLSRANVARKASALAIGTGDVVPEPKSEPAPKPRLTKHDSTEMLANINGMLNGIVESLPFIDPADIDAAANKAVISNIHHSMGHIRTLLKGIQNNG